MGEVVAVAGVEPHPIAILAGNDPKTLVLDLVQPQPTSGRDLGLRKAGEDEAGEHTQHAGFIEPAGQSRQAPQTVRFLVLTPAHPTSTRASRDREPRHIARRDHGPRRGICSGSGEKIGPKRRRKTGDL